MRARELAKAEGLRAAGDLDGARELLARIVHLYPLDSEVRITAAAAALAAGDRHQAGAHLFLAADPLHSAILLRYEILADECDQLVTVIEAEAQRDPLAVFQALDLRDVPDPARLAPAPAQRMVELLAELAARDHPRQRLEAMLYAQRRGLPRRERAQAIGCLIVTALLALAVTALAVVGVLAILES
jgi:hypothetical protein